MGFTGTDSNQSIPTVILHKKGIISVFFDFTHFFAKISKMSKMFCADSPVFTRQYPFWAFQTLFGDPYSTPTKYGPRPVPRTPSPICYPKSTKYVRKYVRNVRFHGLVQKHLRCFCAYSPVFTCQYPFWPVYTLLGDLYSTPTKYGPRPVPRTQSPIAPPKVIIQGDMAV